MSVLNIMLGSGALPRILSGLRCRSGNFSPRGPIVELNHDPEYLTREYHFG